MSSPSDTEKKSGIFGKRAINSSSRADIASSCKIPTANTSPTAQESTKQATRKLSVSKLVDERVRGRVSTKGASSAPNSSRYKESNVGDADDLGSPWRKVNVSSNWFHIWIMSSILKNNGDRKNGIKEIILTRVYFWQDLIEDLDSSLGDFDKKFKQKEKIGEVLQRKKSAESPPTSDDDFCLAPGVNRKLLQINVYYLNHTNNLSTIKINELLFCHRRVHTTKKIQFNACCDRLATWQMSLLEVRRVWKRFTLCWPGWTIKSQTMSICTNCD